MKVFMPYSDSLQSNQVLTWLLTPQTTQVWKPQRPTLIKNGFSLLKMRICQQTNRQTNAFVKTLRTEWYALFLTSFSENGQSFCENGLVFWGEEGSFCVSSTNTPSEVLR